MIRRGCGVPRELGGEAAGAGVPSPNGDGGENLRGGGVDGDEPPGS